MSNITLTDTGKLTISNTGTTTAVSPATVELKGVSVGYTIGNNIDSSPEPSKFTNAIIVLGSKENATITIEGIMLRTSTTDMDNLKTLRDMIQTKGIKLFYYGSTADNYRDITDSLGTENQTDAHVTPAAGFQLTPTPFPHLHVHVTGFQVTQNPEEVIRYRLTLIETN